MHITTRRFPNKISHAKQVVVWTCFTLLKDSKYLEPFINITTITSFIQVELINEKTSNFIRTKLDTKRTSSQPGLPE